VIESRFLSYGDVWSADIIPHDGYEYGVRYSTATVQVAGEAPVADELKILPVNPNENDILKAVYSVTTSDADKSQIRWYLNNVLQPDHNDEQYARMPFKAGDSVRVEVTPYDGVTFRFHRFFRDDHRRVCGIPR
jgi:hypothetical protein